MKKAYITENCLGDPICFARLNCPSKAIKKSTIRTKIPIWFFRRSEVEIDKCRGCGKCVRHCLHKAIKLVETEVHIDA